MLASERKFEEVDLPLILASFHKAINSGKYTEVTVKFSHEGGCLEVKSVSTEKIK